MATKNKLRKKSVVDAKVQWTLASRVVIHFFVFVCVGLFFGLIGQVLSDPMGGLKRNLDAYWSQACPMFLALVFLMPVFIRDTLTLSNRVAGPIHNLRQTCQKLADGEADVQPLKFRDHDMWPDLPETFNRMTERLRNESPDATSTEASQEADSATESRELLNA